MSSINHIVVVMCTGNSLEAKCTLTAVDKHKGTVEQYKNCPLAPLRKHAVAKS